MSYNICNKKGCNQYHDNYYYGLCLVEMGEEMDNDCLMRHKGKNFNRANQGSNKRGLFKKGVRV